MAKQLLVLEEVIAMLKTISAPNRVIDDFRKRAEFVLHLKPAVERDEIQVSSGFGAASRQGLVELTLNDQRTQMDVRKAREIGLMLIEAAEAATSDEIVMRLLTDKVGLAAEQVAHVLIDLREIRQGTRDVRWPTS